MLKNNTGKDKDIIVAQCFVYTVKNFTLKRFVKELITKKYKCGVTAKVASTILPDLIKNEHEIMLAHKFEGKMNGPVNISLKLDGIRCTALIDDKGHVVFKTRQGKIIKGLLEIKMALKAYNLTSCMLDGELIRINKDNLPSDENFRLTTEIVNSKQDNKTGLEFVLFDVTPLSSYYDKECDMDYRTRMILLQQLLIKRFMRKKGVILVGGFHEIIELCEISQREIIGIIDNHRTDECDGYPILGTDQDAPLLFEKYQHCELVISPDAPKLRKRLVDYYANIGFSFATLITSS